MDTKYVGGSSITTMEKPIIIDMVND